MAVLLVVVGGSEGVEVLHELAESEGLAADADAGLERFEAAREGGVGGVEERRGEDELGGVARNLEKLIDAVALREISFYVVQ